MNTIQALQEAIKNGDAPLEFHGRVIRGIDGGRIEAAIGGVTYTAMEAVWEDNGWRGLWRSDYSGRYRIRKITYGLVGGTWEVAA